MKLTGNTILITGGTSGIGFELASRFVELGNQVIVTGRSASNLEAARGKLPGLHAIQSDVADPQQIVDLYRQVAEAFPRLNLLINNAGIMRKLDLQAADADLQDLTREIDINLSGTIRMAVQFLPLLKRQPEAAIVNVSSGLAFVPLPISPVYSATKAALHSFTQSLRIQLRNTRVKVIELAPPGTDTPLFAGDFGSEDTGGVKPMPLAVLVKHALAGLAGDKPEIRPGLANVLKLMSRLAPGFIVNQLGKSAASMSAQHER
jgi:uncharacterized oxidoreductase